MLKKGRTTRFRSNYHPELSVEDMLSINSIQRRTVLPKHRSSDVQSAEYSASQFYIERGAKNAMNGGLEYEYFRLQNLEKMFFGIIAYRHVVKRR
jgi:hypothetical protein